MLLLSTLHLSLELEEMEDPSRGMTALGEDSIQRERPSCLVARRNLSCVGGVGVTLPLKRAS